MCMYVSVCVCMCVCMCMSVYVCLCRNLDVSVRVCLCVCLCVCMCLSVSVCLCRYLDVSGCVCLCISVSVSVSLCIYVCMCLSVSACVSLLRFCAWRDQSAAFGLELKACPPTWLQKTHKFWRCHGRESLLSTGLRRRPESCRYSPGAQPSRSTTVS